MNDVLRILHLEDSPIDAELVLAKLEQDGLACVVDRVDTRGAFAARLAQGGFDLVLADYTLPSFDGLTALTMVRERFPEVPVIFVSGTIGEDRAVETFKSGATDYVLKSHLSRLVPSIRRALREDEEREERRRAEEATRKSEKKYQDLFSSTLDGIFQTDADGVFTLMNLAGARIFGFDDPGEVIGRKALDFWSDPKDRDVYLRELRARKRLSAYPIRGRKMDGEPIELESSTRIMEDEQGRFMGIEGVLRDVTARKRAQQEQEITAEFLRFVNESTDTAGLIREAVTFFQRESGCEAVGIRLRQGEDYPYFEARGFPREFVLLENSLCARNDAGCIIRGSTGDPVIECMCGNVICGRFDPAKSFFTSHGSFWSNNTTELLRTTTDEDRQARTRNRCNGSGYESVALLPLRVGEQRLGLLQFNDRRTNVFSPETIALWERLASQLAIALAKFQSDEALRKSEEKYRHLVENLGKEYFFYQHDTNGVFTYVSPSVEDMLGYSRADAMVHYQEYLTDNPVNAVVVRHTELSVQGISQSPYPTEVRHKDGGTRWLEVSEYPVRNAEGRVTGVEGIARDITERKRAEDALREFTRLNHQIIESVQEGIVVYGRDLKYLLWNPFMERMTGVPAAEVLGRHPVEVFPFLAEAGVLAAAERALAGEVAEMERFRYPRPGGGTGWASDKSAPLRNAAGEIIGVIATVRDITDHVNAEEQVLAAASEWSASFDAMTDGISIHDLDNRIINVNLALCRMLGTTREKMIGRKCFDVFHGHDGLASVCPLHRLKRTRQQEQAELFEQSLGKWLSVSASPIFDGAGGIARIVHTVRDITERKKVEEDRARLEDQLRHIQKMEAIGQLAGGVAHDFNNILNVIIGYGDLVLQGLGPDIQAKERMREVLAAADRGATLTKRLLAFSRHDSADLKPHALADIVKGVEEMLGRIIGEDIAFATDLADGGAVVQADRGQLEQVLMNLAANARDAMPRGGSLAIRTGRKEIDDLFLSDHGYGVPGRYAVIAVADTGAGMDPETQKKIFEPFFTTKEVGEGTGLGLSIVYGIVKQHKGFIQVESEPGRGTTFEVLLPLAEKPAATERGEALSPANAGGTETVLVAEDDDATRKLMKLVLETFGYTVIDAADGDDAVARFLKNRDQVRLVMLDVIMPKMGGREAGERIRAVRPDVKVLFISGYTADRIDAEALQEHGVHFIHKPIAPRRLLEKVRQILDS